MAAQILEMQRQQAAQTAALNAYSQRGFIPSAPQVYPQYPIEDVLERCLEQKPRDYNALVDIMKEEIYEEMVQARGSHAQQHYNQGGQANVKPSYGVVRNQTRHRQESSMRPFPWMGSSYATKIIEAIPNLYAGLNALTSVISAGEVGSSK
ncbi:Uncharacterized protein Fot_37836 [Forsythia ovata]|uniref:Uncharacterized protein n=1 Tax=Forsythia ovata TaxID=205694 RepID=A0ABD1S465_9LAMI